MSPHRNASKLYISSSNPKQSSFEVREIYIEGDNFWVLNSTHMFYNYVSIFNLSITFFNYSHLDLMVAHPSISIFNSTGTFIMTPATANYKLELKLNQ